MPTFKNTNDKPIYYEVHGKQYCFEPNKEYALDIWIPYGNLGLELIDENYPAVREDVLVSSSFRFSNGLVRRFNIEPCESYEVDIEVKKGAAKLSFGTSKTLIDLTDKFISKKTWSYAPYRTL